MIGLHLLTNYPLNVFELQAVYEELNKFLIIKFIKKLKMIFIYTDNVYLKLTMLVNKRTTKLPFFIWNQSLILWKYIIQLCKLSSL